MKISPLVILAVSARRQAAAFVMAPSRVVIHLPSVNTVRSLAGSPTRNCIDTGSQSHGLAALPTAEDVSTDDFMKQLGHASQIIPLLHPHTSDKEMNEEESASLLEILSRQFSHSDGIRGFFAVYLTSPESQTVDEVPNVLANAVRGADTKIMVPLACMNVIMPTAMQSIHQDAELKECASKTASNGKKILRILKGNDEVINNCKAISRVCEDAEKGPEEEGTDNLTEYWEKFFVNYKYEEQQKKDIALAVSEFC
mmetsp:Transcript_38965/g.81903  ORF Transcript_38965/g.81903 Transcript_38965/m.81903 type:complete len:255 (+) Transcript_38965:106-870(+)|eukprot:CAMPEP_0183739136 /NCGR_PEP_ID=MMETSP0737-20130205/56305_1 /TAXON_ID=385413 /ORGANISM="Thalassiosira miniscula, Strain CCMP1093" /LENGTH=254 /DNA_ID=CAMNT_0025973857 /DNA_START=74 /DNA_END=838 /DNA_ORIENTATION=+